MIYKRVQPMFAVRCIADGQQYQLLFECESEQKALELAGTYLMLQCKVCEIYSVREV